MNIYIISLPNSSRRRIVSQRLDAIGVKHHFIDAIDKNLIDDAQVSQIYNETDCIERYGRPLVKAEIACFLSHRKAWAIVQHDNNKSIILEDDAFFAKNFCQAIQILGKEEIIADAVLLGHSKLPMRREKYHYFHNPIIKEKKFGQIVIGRVFKLWTSGMVGYYLTPKGASTLLRNNLIIESVSDDWNFHSSNGLVVKELRPYQVWEDYENIPSNIEPERYIASIHRKKIYNLALEPIRITRAVIRNLRSLALSKQE